ncbi:hypothetical protein OG2516_02559 [Oceanicola granulosus HTCC2516]|uniref:Uncharacterized protein n=1 Tax=Oceanicola granulosus (strain ATCC BAA-861 / DSM 15982 / KCTC 12143 / HTCC2516) TaxID=314256 RepID=Q2CHL2_OCEGH|nr:hypothetical protein [Oceanicola granulosus]EAR52282.1 hypothetical protein OG2516_02559 [Oceanicola granulosus HTCC2516]
MTTPLPKTLLLTGLAGAVLVGAQFVNDPEAAAARYRRPLRSGAARRTLHQARLVSGILAAAAFTVRGRFRALGWLMLLRSLIPAIEAVARERRWWDAKRFPSGATALGMLVTGLSLVRGGRK